MVTLRPLVVVPAILALGVAAFVAVNLFDEELTPEARALFARQTAQRPVDPDAGWVLMAGFDAPAGQDPREYARARRRTVPTTLSGKKRPVDGPSGLQIRAADEVLCFPQRRDCIRAFALRPDSIDTAAADNAVLLARYDELLRARDLGDPVDDFSYEARPTTLLVARTQTLRMSQVAAAAARGRVDAALAWLEADAAFYRRWLRDSLGVGDTTFAALGLNRGLVMAGQILRRVPALTDPQRQSLERIAAPLSPSERRIAAVVQATAANLTLSVDDMIANPRALGALTGAPPFIADLVGRTMRRNATLNFAAPLLSSWSQTDALSSDALVPSIAEIRAAARRHLEPGWRWSYNFTGRAFLSEWAYDIGQYVYRMRDPDAYAGLLRCAVALRAEGIAAAGAPAFVASNPACIDPYRAQPFAWDAERAELSFKPEFNLSTSRLGGANGRVTFGPYGT